MSLIYLICGSLAAIGFVAFFNRWPAPFIAFFCLAIPFYLAALTYTLLIHPAICLAFMIHHAMHNKPYKVPLLHLIWSALIAGIFYTLIFNGYIITA